MSKQIEEWKPIQGYEGLYEVSDWGRVKGVDRIVFSKGGNVRLARGRIIKPYIDKDGYERVGLHKDGIRKIFGVHRLVAEAFLNKIEGKEIIDHIDGNPSNNNKENLRWATVAENNRTDIAKKRKSIASFKRTDNKRKIRQYSMNMEHIRDFDSLHEIERELGFDNSSIVRVCKGKQKTSYGFKWEYLD